MKADLQTQVKVRNKVAQINPLLNKNISSIQSRRLPRDYHILNYKKLCFFVTVKSRNYNGIDVSWMMIIMRTRYVSSYHHHRNFHQSDVSFFSVKFFQPPAPYYPIILRKKMLREDDKDENEESCDI